MQLDNLAESVVGGGIVVFRSRSGYSGKKLDMFNDA
jgi:hypothetical protein